MLKGTGETKLCFKLESLLGLSRVGLRFQPLGVSFCLGVN